MVMDRQLVEIVVVSLESTKLFFMNCNWAVIELSLICKTLFLKQNLSNVKHKLLAKVSKLTKLLTISWSCKIIDWSWLWGGSSRYLMSIVKRHSMVVK
jgi:hypothetical protein